MDNKITLSFDENIISKAKKYAENNNISLSRLIEFLLKKVTANNYNSLEDFPISDWVNQVAEGDAVYQTKTRRTRKAAKAEYFNSTGNAGMAKGGSGDVLTGILTGLMAQGYPSLEACLLGVYLHGMAGDVAADKFSEEAIVAGDIIECLGEAFKQIAKN